MSPPIQSTGETCASHAISIWMLRKNVVLLRAARRELGRPRRRFPAWRASCFAMRKRNTPSTAAERQTGCLAREAEDPLVLHGSVPIIIDAAARGLCRLGISSRPGDGPSCEVGGERELLADWPVTLRLQFRPTGHDVRGFARDVPAGLGKCLNRRCRLGAIGVTAIKFASDG